MVVSRVFTFSVWLRQERFDDIPHGFRRSTPGEYNTLRIGPVCVAFGLEADE